MCNNCLLIHTYIPPLFSSSRNVLCNSSTLPSSTGCTSPALFTYLQISQFHNLALSDLLSESATYVTCSTSDHHHDRWIFHITYLRSSSYHDCQPWSTICNLSPHCPFSVAAISHTSQFCCQFVIRDPLLHNLTDLSDTAQ